MMGNPVHEKKLADASHADLWAMLGALHQDFTQALENLNKNDTPYHRRTYVRAAFASMEGLVFHLKQDALRHQDRLIFSLAEIALLLEESYTLDKGKAEIQTKFLPLDQNFPFAVAMFSKGMQSPFVLEKGDTDWDAFKRAIQVRHRITHPKHPDLLEVGEQEIEDVGIAYRLVVMSVVHSLSGAVTALRSETEAILNEHGIKL